MSTEYSPRVPTQPGVEPGGLAIWYGTPPRFMLVLVLVLRVVVSDATEVPGGTSSDAAASVASATLPRRMRLVGSWQVTVQGVVSHTVTAARQIRLDDLASFATDFPLRPAPQTRSYESRQRVRTKISRRVSQPQAIYGAIPDATDASVRSVC